MNQFLHNFKENEQIFDRLKINKLFKENEQFSMALSIGQQNEHILSIFKRQLADLWCDYRENDIF